MLLHGVVQSLGLSSYLPDSNLSFRSSTYQTSAVWCWCDGCAAVVVSVVNDVHQLPRLRQEGSDLPIVPAADNGSTIGHETYRKRLYIRHLNPQEFLSASRVPDSNIVHGTRGKQFTISFWVCQVIYSTIMASVPQLRIELICVHPVDIGLGCSTEEVSVILSEWNAGHTAEDLALCLDLHVLDVYLGQGAITWSDDHIAIW